ncbi:hypothetical protein F4678DRAFT_478976 [Xylaria arbuscula]|nr:hypothetical protein F4678DRAFT_478976 [Xylaria arbuscula]
MPLLSRSNTRFSIPFFNFPAEIRLKIYREFLTADEFIIKRTGPDSPAKVEFPTSKPIDLNILLLNRQAYHEAAAVLYGENHFVFYEEHDDVFRVFLNGIGIHNAKLLTDLYIDLLFKDKAFDKAGRLKPRRKDISRLRILQQFCPNIRKLVLRLDVAYPGHFGPKCNWDDVKWFISYFPLIDEELRKLPELGKDQKREIRVESEWETCDNIQQDIRGFRWKLLECPQVGSSSSSC